MININSWGFEDVKKYEEQYHFMVKPTDDERIPSLSPDDNASEREYDIMEFPVGAPPFVFVNGGREYNKKRGIGFLKTVPAILFDGADLLIPGRTREKLVALDIPNLHMYPSVYIHDDGKWYEDYWYMSFIERFDCWSRSKSDYEKDSQPIRLGGFELHQIYHYGLDDELLNAIPESQRLLFKMGGSLRPLIVCHESILSIFKSGNASGVEFIRVGDY